MTWVQTLIASIGTLWVSILESVNALLIITPASWESADPSNPAAASPWNYARGVHEGLMDLAVAIMVVLWAISFFKYTESLHRIDLREVMGWILRFALIYAIMLMGFELMEAIMDVCVGVANKIITDQGPLQDTFTAPQDVLDAADDNAADLTSGNIFSMIGAFFDQLLPSLALLIVWLVVFACGIVIVLTLFLRFFKLYIYTAIAPIPLSTLVGSETQDIGRHFLKSWLAVCLEVCIIAVSIGIFTASLSGYQNIFNIGGTDLFEKVTAWAVDMCIKIVLLTTVVRSADQISNKIVGTG